MSKLLFTIPLWKIISPVLRDPSQKKGSYSASLCAISPEITFTLASSSSKPICSRSDKVKVQTKSSDE